MISEAVRLNNESVMYLQKGNPLEAFHLLSMASELVAGNTRLQQQSQKGKGFHVPFHYSWAKLASPSFNGYLNLARSFDDGSSMSPYLQALHVCLPWHAWNSKKYGGNGVCSCGIAWVLWYNEAIVCIILGLTLGGHFGNQYLKRAHELFELVMNRVGGRSQNCKDWITLKMAILNNQGCILQELSQFEEAKACLEQLKTAFLENPIQPNSHEWNIFCMNLALIRPSNAASAA